MRKSRIPYFDFYPSDFMHGVRGLSAQEVGVYTMILCRIYEENGPVEYHTMRLATYCGMREATFIKTIEKLVDLDKLEVAEGMISNRRAMSEISSRANKLKINSKAGKASAEKRQQKQRHNPTDVQQALNQSESEPKDTIVSNARTRETTDDDSPQKQTIDVKVLTKKLTEAADGKIQPHGSLVVGQILALISNGVDLETDILPTIRLVAGRMQRPAGSWAYFVGAIREAYNNRIKAGEGLIKPETPIKRAEISTLPKPEQERKWEFYLQQARLNRRWLSTLGPMPGQVGCKVPAHLLQPDDGLDWSDFGSQAA